MGMAKIENGEIVIRIPIDVLASAPLFAWDREFGEHRYEVETKEGLAGSLVYRLNEETETGETPVHRMLDAAAVRVVEQGDEGVIEKALERLGEL
jgi:hypothetical protein